MPRQEDISFLHLPGYQIIKLEGSLGLTVCVRFIGKRSCAFCEGLRLRIKESFVRLIRHESNGSRSCYLKVFTHRFFCLSCKRSFRQRLPGILKFQRASEGFRKEVVEKHHHGIAQKTLARLVNISSATIERWYQQIIAKKFLEKCNTPAPLVMGIDEHFFTKKKGYATTICDLKNHCVADVVLGRSEASLRGYLNKLSGKERTKVVVMDLSETYRSIVKKYFPNALIVADRFHVIRLINQHFIKTWGLLDPRGRKNRGLLSLIRRHATNLNPHQVERLRIYLRAHPGLEVVYDFKQELSQMLLLKSLTKMGLRRILPRLLAMIEALRLSPFDSLRTLGETLYSWKEEVARMLRFTKTNGITEGFHNKMETISRKAYGFRNFENYRLRVLVNCSRFH